MSRVADIASRFRQIDGFVAVPEPEPDDQSDADWMIATMFELALVNIRLIGLIAHGAVILEPTDREEIDRGLKRATELSAEILTRKVGVR